MPLPCSMNCSPKFPEKMSVVKMSVETMSAERVSAGAPWGGRPLVLLAALAIACGPTFTSSSGKSVSGSGDGTEGEAEGQDTGEGEGTPEDTGPTQEELDLEWDGARLEILSPHSGDFIPLGETAGFEAVVYDAAGEATSFTDITWTSDIDAAWAPTGALFEDSTLGVGEHALTATALLPNGDRLAYAVGGVLVQAEDAGTYAGDLKVDLTLSYGGTDYPASCIGSATIIVDVYGEAATGEAGCTLSLLGYELDASHTFDYTLVDGDVSGDSSVNLYFTEYAFDTVGTIGDGALLTTWADSPFDGMTIEGELDVVRLTRDTEAGG
jgi:hypothetical protein